MLCLVLDHKKKKKKGVISVKSSCNFYFIDQKLSPLPPHHTPTYRKGKTVITIQVNDMVGKPPGQSSPQYMTSHSTQVIPLKYYCLFC